jgi:dCTP deaminase
VSEVWDKWVPGVLSKIQLLKLAEPGGFLKNASDRTSFDHSAVDLHLSGEAYRLTRGSVKPFGRDFVHRAEGEGLLEKLEANDRGEFVLQDHKTYLFRLKESIEGKGGGVIWGQATAKSSVGRLDVLVRLIVDGMYRYERFDPEALVDGTTPMFVEVTPITFSVVVKEGVSLNQLRLFFGRPEDCELKSPLISRTCLFEAARDHHLTVDLSGVEVYGESGCGYRAKTASGNPIHLAPEKGADKLDPANWWDLIPATAESRLLVTKNHFYILRSKELLSLPPGVAVYARAIDEEIGEMRIHYAGFAHPFFGWERSDGKPGTPLIFEVRGHDVNVNLRQGEILARLQFFRMSMDAVKDPSEADDYGNQILKLSKYFADWSSAPNVVTGDTSE